jgi:hypothetical protein
MKMPIPARGLEEGLLLDDNSVSRLQEDVSLEVLTV